MSTTSTVTCPSCGVPISIDEALTRQLQATIKAELKTEHSAQTEKRIREAETAAKVEVAAKYQQQAEETQKHLR